jgi:hypothetical protein
MFVLFLTNIIQGFIGTKITFPIIALSCPHFFEFLLKEIIPFIELKVCLRGIVYGIIAITGLKVLNSGQHDCFSGL